MLWHEKKIKCREIKKEHFLISTFNNITKKKWNSFIHRRRQILSLLNKEFFYSLIANGIFLLSLCAFDGNNNLQVKQKYFLSCRLCHTHKRRAHIHNEFTNIIFLSLYNAVKKVTQLYISLSFFLLALSIGSTRRFSFLH